MTRFGLRVCLLGISALLGTAAGGQTASATAPTVVWQATGVRTGYPNAVFSVDGTAILITKSTGFELRRASDGVLLNTLTLPAASQAYDAAAFSPDKTLVGLNLFNNAVGTIEIWKLSTGTLQRTITTDAVMMPIVTRSSVVSTRLPTMSSRLRSRSIRILPRRASRSSRAKSRGTLPIRLMTSLNAPRPRRTISAGR